MPSLSIRHDLADITSRLLYFVAKILLIRPLRSLKQDPPVYPQSPTQTLIVHCEDLALELRQWETAYPRGFERASDLTMWLYYMVAFTILPLLESYPQVHSPFVQSCRFFSITSHHWPACNAVLRGLKAVSQQICTPLPAACEL